MEHKTWLWRKKSFDKASVTSKKADISSKWIEDETLIAEDKEGSERFERSLNERLAPVLCDCKAKDYLMTIHAKMAEEAIAGREKVEAELVSLKQERDEALQLGVTANVRLTQLDVSLKEKMQQLASVQQEEEQKIQDAVTKSSRDFEKMQKILEEKLRDASKRLANLAADNSYLSKTLQDREELIKDLHKCKSQSEAEVKVLMERLDTTEKENTSLKYEFRMLEKEVEVRNVERDFNRRSADALEKQQVESVKKMTKLETECQRLRSLLRKRMPGPSALAKIRGEVITLGRDQTEMRRGKLDPRTGGLSARGNSLENSPENPSTKIGILIEQLCGLEEENKILKEILTEKNNELHDTKMVYAQISSKLARTEAQLRELSRGQKSMELTRCSPKSNELSLSVIEVGNDDGFSSSGSWANALTSELEHFRCKSPQKHTKLGVADMSLMDDFVEMEKLAIVSVDMPLENSHVSSSASNVIPNNMEKELGVLQSDLTGKELVSVAQDHSSFGDTERKIQTVDGTTTRSSDWIQDVLKAILEENSVSGRSFDELLEDIRIALLYVNHPKSSKANAAIITSHPEESDPLRLRHSDYITWKSPSPSPSAMEESLNGISRINGSTEERQNQQTQSNLSKSICKIIELIKDINPASSMDHTTQDKWKTSSMSEDYIVSVFQWKKSELSAVIEQFILTCNDLLNAKSGLETFVGELTYALDWIMSNCITHQDVSSVRDKIKQQFGWERQQDESELKVVADSPVSESDIVVSAEKSSILPHVTTPSGQTVLIQMQETQSNLQEEFRGLRNELNNMEFAKKDLIAKLHYSAIKNETLMKQLQESEQRIGRIQTELETMKASKGMIEDQIENQNSINEDLDTQLTVSKAKLNEVLQKFSSLEVELEDKCNSCEELESTCLELQLQLESTTKDTPKYNTGQDDKQLQTGWEITTASMKLAECQETILNLGKQLKALASQREMALYDKVFSTTGTVVTTANNSNLSNHPSLRNQMLAEDYSRGHVQNSPTTKELISGADKKHPSVLPSNNCSTLGTLVVVEPPQAYLASKHKASSAGVGPLAIVTSKKHKGDGGFLRKLLLRRKKVSSSKTSLTFGIV